MHTRRVWMFIIGMVLALGSGVAACGGGGSTNNAGTSGGGTHQDLAADRAAAEAASLRLSDFPSGWTSKPHSTSDPNSSTALDSEMASCLGVSESKLADAPVTHNSPDFEKGTNTVSSTVDYRATAAEQTAVFEVWSNPKLPSCLASAFGGLIEQQVNHPSDPADTLPPGASIGTPTVTRMSLAQFGDKSLGYEIKIPFSVESLSLDVYANAVLVKKGRASVAMMFLSFLTPPSTSDIEHYTGAVVGRLTRTA